jgi:kynurenine formamidase
MTALLDQLLGASVYDLAQPYFAGMPHFPTHPPFLFGLTKKHGEFVLSNGGSSAADAIAMCSHNGTHIDALNHFSCGGKLHGEREVADVQSYTGGVTHLSAGTLAPILRRGVMLDIAGLLGVPVLGEDTVVTPGHLQAAADRQGVQIRQGDVVLLRTGYARYFEDAPRYVSKPAAPGVEIEGARWLSERKIFAAGSDTMAFERLPSPEMAVHIHLLVEKGIHIIENLNLEDLSLDSVYEFAFAGAPLKIRGATGAPMRPLALVSR